MNNPATILLISTPSFRPSLGSRQEDGAAPSNSSVVWARRGDEFHTANRSVLTESTAKGDARLACPEGSPRPARAPSGTALVLSGPIVRADIPALCERV